MNKHGTSRQSTRNIEDLLKQATAKQQQPNTSSEHKTNIDNAKTKQQRNKHNVKHK